MTLREKQSRFAQLTGLLILFVYQRGYEMTYGDAWAKDGHKKNSKHYDRLALDINLFYDGNYLKETEDYKFLGDFWKLLDPECTWGGDWGEGCHFSYGEN